MIDREHDLPITKQAEVPCRVNASSRNAGMPASTWHRSSTVSTSRNVILWSLMRLLPKQGLDRAAFIHGGVTHISIGLQNGRRNDFKTSLIPDPILVTPARGLGTSMCG
jgi:hypothetical protein